MKEFELWPAIDIIDGKPVRLIEGKYSSKKEYEISIEQILSDFNQFAFGIHVVDLDGAKKGKITNKQTLKNILSLSSVPVEVGGGVRKIETIEELLILGVNRIIIGTGIFENDFVTKIVKKNLQDRIVIGLDIKENRLAIKGWTQQTQATLLDIIPRFRDMGFNKFIVTDITKDGKLSGVNLGLYKELLKKFPKTYLIASGGISQVSDLNTLKKIRLAELLSEKHITKKEFQSLNLHHKMFTNRIIPCLDIKGNRTVKGVKFKELKDVGSPVELAQFYAEQGADELVFLDISATQEKRKTLSKLALNVSKTLHIPFTIGGGISSLEDAEILFDCGADKVSVNSSAVKRPKLISEISKKFGNQALVLAVDVKKNNHCSWKVFVNGGTKETLWDAFDWIREGENLGVGEILLTSMDKDGTKSGFDLTLYREIKNVTNLPIIASGGVGKKEHFYDLFKNNLASGGLAASVFHFDEIRINMLKHYLLKNKISVRI